MCKLSKICKCVPKPVWAVFGVALILRLIGFWHSIPLTINIDEPTLVSAVIALKSALNPGHFDWPHLFIYISFPLYMIAYGLRAALGIITELPTVWNTAFYFFVVSRLFNAFLGALTVIAIYKVGESVYNRRVGLLASAIFAVLPLSVYEDHFSKVETAVTLLCAVCLYFAWQIYKKNTTKSYILAGVFVGLAASTKYNGALMALFVIAASCLHYRKHAKKLTTYAKNLVSAGVASILAFVVGTPFALLDYKTFLSTDSAKGALWQSSTNLGHIPWDTYANKVLWAFFTRFRLDLGIGIWALFLLACILFLFFNRRRKEDVFLILPTIVLVFITSRFKRSPPHYFLYLMPAVALITSKMLLEVKEKFKLLAPMSLFAVGALFLAEPLVMDVVNVYKFSRQDTRTQTYHWIVGNMEESDKLYSVGLDIDGVSFRKDNEERVPELDDRILKLHEQLPFYVLIGQEGISLEDLTEGNMDPEELSGNSSRILEKAELVFYAPDTGRFGPPVYIFKVVELGR